MRQIFTKGDQWENIYKRWSMRQLAGISQSRWCSTDLAQWVISKSSSPLPMDLSLRNMKSEQNILIVTERLTTGKVSSAALTTNWHRARIRSKTQPPSKFSVSSSWFYHHHLQHQEKSTILEVLFEFLKILSLLFFSHKRYFSCANREFTYWEGVESERLGGRGRCLFWVLYTGDFWWNFLVLFFILNWKRGQLLFQAVIQL